jgi:hypothetical protein
MNRLNYLPRHLSVKSPIFACAALLLLSLTTAFADDSQLMRISQDPYPADLAQHATEVEPVLVARGDTIVSAFQVGRFTGVGADNIGWATSLDAGKTWRRGFLRGTTPVAGGTWPAVSLPTIAYDQKHKTYLIAMMPFDDNGDGRGILVSRSTDGLQWAAPIVAASTAGANGHWFTCDNTTSSPHYGNCYDAYLDYSGNNSYVNALVVSKDGGRTWSAPVSSPDQAAGLPTSIAIQPNGHFVVLGRGGGITGDQQYAIPSIDGGHTLQQTAVITTQQFDYPWMRADPNISSAVDASGTIYAVFPDCRFRANCSDPGCRFEATTSFCATNDLVLTTSRNGVDWSPLKRIPVDRITSTVDHVITGLAVLSSGKDSAHTKLALTYYFLPNGNLPDGTTCDYTNCLIRAGYIASPDGGRSWTEPTKIGGPMAQEWLAFTYAGEMVADYISAVFVNGKPFSAFAIAHKPDPISGLFDEAIYGVQLSEE